MTTADGLMAFFAEFDENDVEAFRQWHNREHMAERVSIPGFLRGARYRGLDTPERFLMTYETQSPAVLGSKPYHAAVNNPTPWTKQALHWFRNPARAIYVKVTEAGGPGWRTAPYALAVRFNHAGNVEDFARGTGLLALPQSGGAQRVGVYAVDQEISGIMTSERQIYGGGQGEQEYLIIVELSEPFDAAPTLPGADTLAAEGASDLFVDRLAIDFAQEAPQ